LTSSISVGIGSRWHVFFSPCVGPLLVLFLGVEPHALEEGIREVKGVFVFVRCRGSLGVFLGLFRTRFLGIRLPGIFGSGLFLRPDFLEEGIVSNVVDAHSFSLGLPWAFDGVLVPDFLNMEAAIAQNVFLGLSTDGGVFLPNLLEERVIKGVVMGGAAGKVFSLWLGSVFWA